MVSFNFLTLLKRRTRFSRFIIIITAFICILFYTQHNAEDQTVPYDDQIIPNNLIIPLQNKTILNDLVAARLRSHTQFFNRPSSSCNAREVLTAEKTSHYDRIGHALSKFHQRNIPLYSEDYFHGRGIVLTVGNAQISQCKVNLKMIERTQTRLPVQIWYSSSELSNETVYELLHFASKLKISLCSFTNAECRSTNKTWKLNSAYVFSPSDRQKTARKHFPYKPAAIISATFAEILFLDSDAYLVRDPEYLFEFDPMYLRFGALFFPDAILSQQSTTVWKLLNTTCTYDEPEVDSGALLVDKKRVWKALYITKLMNDQYKMFYKWFSGGDKDTFRLAFRFLDVKYYMVGIVCSTGYYDGRNFCGYTMCKTDSLGRYIFINHFSLMKYVDRDYSSPRLRYTRIGLGNPYNHPFYMQYCPLAYANSCLYVDTQLNESTTINKCISRPINKSEIDDHVYNFSEPLISEQFQNNRMLMSETNNLMPGFIGSLLYYRKKVYGEEWTKSLEN